MASILTPHYAITPAFWSVERYFAASLGACWLAPTCSHSFTIRDEVGFFKVVRDACGKRSRLRQKREAHLDTATHQLVSKVIEALGVVDLFAAMGLKTPDLSILSDEDLSEGRDLPHRNLGLESLENLLNDEIKARSRRNARGIALVPGAVGADAHRLSEPFYRDGADHRAVDRASRKRWEAARRRSVVQVQGCEQLRTIARELVKAVRANVTIDGRCGRT